MLTPPSLPTLQRQHSVVACSVSSLTPPAVSSTFHFTHPLEILRKDAAREERAARRRNPAPRFVPTVNTLDPRMRKHVDAVALLAYADVVNREGNKKTRPSLSSNASSFGLELLNGIDLRWVYSRDSAPVYPNLNLSFIAAVHKQEQKRKLREQREKLDGDERGLSGTSTPECRTPRTRQNHPNGDQNESIVDDDSEFDECPRTIDDEKFDDAGRHTVFGKRSIKYLRFMARAHPPVPANHPLIDSPRSVAILLKSGVHPSCFVDSASSGLPTTLRLLTDLEEEYRSLSQEASQRHVVHLMMDRVSETHASPPRKNKDCPSDVSAKHVATKLLSQHDDLMVDWGRRQQRLAQLKNTETRVERCLQEKNAAKVKWARQLQTAPLLPNKDGLSNSIAMKSKRCSAMVAGGEDDERSSSTSSSKVTETPSPLAKRKKSIHPLGETTQIVDSPITQTMKKPSVTPRTRVKLLHDAATNKRAVILLHAEKRMQQSIDMVIGEKMRRQQEKKNHNLAHAVEVELVSLRTDRLQSFKKLMLLDSIDHLQRVDAHRCTEHRQAAEQRQQARRINASLEQRSLDAMKAASIMVSKAVEWQEVTTLSTATLPEQMKLRQQSREVLRKAIAGEEVLLDAWQQLAVSPRRRDRWVVHEKHERLRKKFHASQMKIAPVKRILM